MEGPKKGHGEGKEKRSRTASAMFRRKGALSLFYGGKVETFEKSRRFWFSKGRKKGKEHAFMKARTVAPPSHSQNP